jgi:hypothetical protein
VFSRRSKSGILEAILRQSEAK